MTRRTQLTLFVPAAAAFEIERVRAAFNPVQHRLIRSHMTLARDEEVADRVRVLAALAGLRRPPVTLRFDPPVRFSDGAGALLPGTDDRGDFAALRRAVLANGASEPRPHPPHITIMHPRNSTCTDALFAELVGFAWPARVAFDHVALIEQVDGEPWQTLVETALDG
jgi:2'-5' RNA ligase